jgi:hypothetical protein
MNSEIDFEALESIRGEDLKKISWKGLPRKYTSKTVNFCPYCRAMIGAVMTAPFVYLWRLYPHKPKPPMTREQILKNSRRRTWISIGIAAGINIGFGVLRLITWLETGEFSELVGATIQISIGILFLTAKLWGSRFIKFIIMLSALMPHRKKIKKIKEPKPKKEHKTWKKIASKHDIICPPIYFVKTKDLESLK